MHTMDLTKGDIRMVLLKFALPYLGASFLQALYGATDLFVVGRFEGPSAISAVNIGSQIMQIITSFVIGCSMGSTVLLAASAGSGNRETSRKGLGSTIVLFLLLAAVLTPAMIAASSGLIALLRTPAEAVAEATTYVKICSAGIPFIIAFNVIAAVFRDVGDSGTPLKIVAVACAINVGGDFFLTAALGMGVRGVAIATAAAQLISSAYGILIMRKQKLPFAFHRKDIRLEGSSAGKILSVGLPVAMQDTLIQISFILITVIANTRGLIDSSAVGVVEKLIMFMFLVPSALLSSISAITAQNVGAGKPERAAATRNFGIMIGMGFGAFVTFVHNVISIFCVRIPAAWFLSHAFPDSLMPMGLASPLGSCMSLLILFIYFRVIQKMKK